MSNQYQVEVELLKEIHELPNAWTNASFKALLDLLEYDGVADIAENEIKDMAILALSELEPEEASEKVLELRLGKLLNEGQRQNLAEELRGDKLWEQYAVISMHEEIFNVACMLHWTYPRKFHEPDIAKVQLKVTDINKQGIAHLKKPTAAFIARILNDGMNEHNTIYRLFKAELASKSFTEAQDIIWQFEGSGFNTEESSNTFTIFTSWNWVDELKGVDEYESAAYGDAVS